MINCSATFDVLLILNLPSAAQQFSKHFRWMDNEAAHYWTKLIDTFSLFQIQRGVQEAVTTNKFTFISQPLAGKHCTIGSSTFCLFPICKSLELNDFIVIHVAFASILQLLCILILGIWIYAKMIEWNSGSKSSIWIFKNEKLSCHFSTLVSG